MVTGSAAQLHQVVANLLANARVHTPPGTDVRVSLSRQDESDGRPPVAVIEVADNGPGVPAELMPEVFERFARGRRFAIAGWRQHRARASDRRGRRRRP